MKLTFSFALTVLSIVYIILIVATSWPSYAVRMEELRVSKIYLVDGTTNL